MKIIFHSCTDGYLTEIQFEGSISRIFYTMQDALEYMRIFLNDIKEIPQERLEHEGLREFVEKSIRASRKLERAD